MISINYLLIYGYGSIPINTIFSGMNIHLPAILMFTRGTRSWHTAIYLLVSIGPQDFPWIFHQRAGTWRLALRPGGLGPCDDPGELCSSSINHVGKNPRWNCRALDVFGDRIECLAVSALVLWVLWVLWFFYFTRFYSVFGRWPIANIATTINHVLADAMSKVGVAQEFVPWTSIHGNSDDAFRWATQKIWCFHTQCFEFSGWMILNNVE